MNKVFVSFFTFSWQTNMQKNLMIPKLYIPNQFKIEIYPALHTNRSEILRWTKTHFRFMSENKVQEVIRLSIVMKGVVFWRFWWKIPPQFKTLSNFSKGPLFSFRIIKPSVKDSSPNMATDIILLKYFKGINFRGDLISRQKSSRNPRNVIPAKNFERKNYQKKPKN